MYQSNSHSENTPKADEGQGNGQSELSVSEANEGKGVALDTPVPDKAPLENKPMIETAEGEIQERRKDSRKKVSLTGGYIVDDSGERGLINLVDVSFSGMRFKLNSMRFLYNKAMMVIKFTLDTFPKTVISRQVVVRNMDGPYVGAEFCDPDQYDGFSLYLKKIK